MLTWETLVKSMESENPNDDHRLICQLLSTFYTFACRHALYNHHSIERISLKELFNQQRSFTLNTSTELYRKFLRK